MVKTMIISFFLIASLTANSAPPLEPRGKQAKENADISRKLSGSNVSFMEKTTNKLQCHTKSKKTMSNTKHILCYMLLHVLHKLMLLYNPNMRYIKHVQNTNSVRML